MCYSKEECNEFMRWFKSTLNCHFDRNPWQYITDFEGTNPKADEELNDIEEQIEALILDADMLSEPDMIEPPETFLTSVSTLTINDAKNFTSILADQAFAHALTSLDIPLT